MRHITEMITKRPFMRPLFLWIMGILLYVFVPDVWLFPFVCLCWLLLLVGLGINCVQKHYLLKYATRWITTMPLILLLLTLSVETCYLRERYPESAFPCWQTEAAKVQSLLVARLDTLSLSDAEKSVLATLTLGYRKAMRQEVRQQFAAAGVAHVLAVSGFHVAIICGLLSGLTLFLRRWSWGMWMRYWLLIVGLWGFVFLTGLSPSAVRAALMLSFYLTGKQLSRSKDSYNTLFAAAFWMLVYRPFFLFDVGFQLSFLAVGFILMWLPIFRRVIIVRNPLVAYLWNSVLVALAAQMGTMALTLFYFKQGSLLFLLTCLPLSLMAMGLIPSTLLWLCFPQGSWIAFYGQCLIEWQAKAMMWLVERCAAIPFATVQWSFDGVEVIAIYALLFLGWMFMEQRRPKQLLAMMGIGLFLSVKIFIGLLL